MPYSVDIDLALTHVKADTTKQLLRVICDQTSPHIGVGHDTLLAHCLDNEAHRKTRAQDGLAIPYVRLPGLRERFITLATLKKPILLSSRDAKPADVMCLFLAPKDGQDGRYLRDLSCIARQLRDKELKQHLQGAQTAEMLKWLVNSYGDEPMAA